MTFRTNVPPLSLGTNDLFDRRLIEQIARETPHDPPVWTNWSKVYNNLVIGNGGVSARWTKNGNVAHIEWALDFGTTTSLSGAPVISLPVDADDAVLGVQPRFNIGPVTYTETGVATYFGGVRLLSKDLIMLEVFDTGATYLRTSQLSPTVPFTWATDDRIGFRCSYRIAT